MNVQDLKEYILENNKIEELLLDLGCSNIKFHSNYYSASNPDGNNKNAIAIYLPNLNVINFTRPNFPDKADIITLVEFIKDLNFFHSLKYICNLFGLDFYSEPTLNLPKSIQITKMLNSMNGNFVEDEDDIPIKPISEAILTYYHTPCVNNLWLKSHVSYATQKLWELGYDDYTNRITIPIRDETSTLIGCKQRLFKDIIEDWEEKFLYIEPCPRNKILYGLYKTYSSIKYVGKVYCFEAEKSVHQAWEYGYKNCISFGGKRIGRLQIEKLVRLNANIILCLDKDVLPEEVEKISERFPEGIPVFAIYDKNNLLKDKESPSDNPDNWDKLVNNNIYKIR